MEPARPTLDQIAVFLAIVEAGSFTAAARKLNRATSVISYAVTNLEAQLGVSLFERAGARRPRLTEAGRAILSDSRGIALALSGLVAKARGLTQGLEAEVSLVVDVMLPAKRLVRGLDEFRTKFPTVALRLRVEALGAVTEAVMEGLAAFGMSGPLPIESDALTRGPAGSIKLVPVAAPGRGAVSALSWNASGTHLAFGTETGFAAVVAIAGAQGVCLLAERPPALDMAERGAARRLAALLRDETGNVDRTAPLG